MDGYDVVSVELQYCGDQLVRLGKDVRDQLRELGDVVDGLLNQHWQGAAAQGFAAGWAQWQEGAHDVLDGLAAMGELLGTSGRGYEGVENATVDAARAVRG